MSYEQLDWNANIKNIDMIATNLVKKSIYCIKKMLTIDIKINRNNFISLLSDNLTELQTFISICNFLKHINDDDHVILKIESAENIVDSHMSQFKNNKDLFVKIYQLTLLSNKTASIAGNTQEIQFLNKIVRLFRNEGILLSSDDKKSFDKLMDKMKNLREKINKSSIVYRTTNIDDNEVALNTNNYKYLMMTQKDSDIRKKIDMIFNNNYSNIANVFGYNIYKTKAIKLLGYPSYAHFKLDEQLLLNPSTVNNLIDELLLQTQDNYLKNIDLLMQEAETSAIGAYDIPYYINEVKKTVLGNFKYQCFNLEYAIGQILKIYTKLLNINFTKLHNAKVWNPTVSMYEISIQQGNAKKSLGFFYLDLYKYGKKNLKPSCVTIKSNGTYALEENKYQNALVLLTASFIEHEQVTITDIFVLIHELCHVIHFICHKSKFVLLNIANMEYDYIEIVAKLFERTFCTKEYIQQIGNLSDDITVKLIELYNFERVLYQRKQCMLSLYDQLVNSHDFNKYIRHVIKYEKEKMETNLLSVYKQIHDKVYGYLVRINDGSIVTKKYIFRIQ